MDTTIDELRAGWEQVREQVKQLADENRKLKMRLNDAQRNRDIMTEWFIVRDELLWWLTALAGRVEHDDIVRRVRQMLATQGYTRENLEKR